MKSLRGLLVTMTVVVVVLSHATMASADGGALRAQRVDGPYRIAVFTSPTPLRSGPIDVSVLVLDRATGEPLPTLDVTVSVSRPEREIRRVEFRATTEQATNKLLRAAQFELRGPGLWDFAIDVRGPRGAAQLDFQTAAADPLPRWVSMWPWIMLPAVVVVLFSIRATFTRLKHCS